MRVDFYHLQKSAAEDVVFVLASKVYETGKRLLIRTDFPERADDLNERLWTMRPDSWLPHGGAKNDFAAQQPVYLTAGTDNPNQAEMLMLVNIPDADAIQKFERTFFIFDGHDETVLTQARAFWKTVAAQGEAHYWAQNDSGKWEEKAHSAPV